eukprot:Gb_38905 [translate_table: standard]
MFPRKIFVARRVQQCLVFFRRLNTCADNGKYKLFPLQNLNKYPAFLSQGREKCKEATLGLDVNEVLPPTRILGISSHFHIRLRYSSSSPQESTEILDEDFLEINAQEVNAEANLEESASKISHSEAATTVETVPKKPIDLLFKEAIGLDNTTGLEEEAGNISSVGGDDFSMPSDLQVESLQNKLDSQWEIINALKESIGDLKSEIKELKSRNASLGSIAKGKDKQLGKSPLEVIKSPIEAKKKSLKGKNEHKQLSEKKDVSEANNEQEENLGTHAKPVRSLSSIFSSSSDDHKKNAAMESQNGVVLTESQAKENENDVIVTKGQVKSSSGKVSKNNRKNGNKSVQNASTASLEADNLTDENTTQRSQSSRKQKISKGKGAQKGPSDCNDEISELLSGGSVVHPWPEWILFLEHLNQEGYLSKARNQKGLIDLKNLPKAKDQGFIKSAAAEFAKDHAHISKLLSGSDLKKVALFGCPSVENKGVFAGKRLRSFFSIEEEIACLPCTMKDTCGAPFAKVPKVKNFELPDVVRLLCIYGLNAKTSLLTIPDDVKLSVLNLLKELVDYSSRSANHSQGLLLQE